MEVVKDAPYGEHRLGSELNGETVRNLFPVLECLLFVAADPVSPAQVGQVLEIPEETATEALEHFRRHYVNGGGLHVVRVAGGYQLRTRPEFANVVATFLRPAAQKLSRQALETLAIVAYEQPITQPEIDLLRGVNSDGVIKTLADRELIREVGRKDAPGRPILYGTTDYFLRHFGLADLSELPKLEESFGAANLEKRELAI
jgi:segregation and condensation protein B